MNVEEDDGSRGSDDGEDDDESEVECALCFSSQPRNVGRAPARLAGHPAPDDADGEDDSKASHTSDEGGDE